MIYNVPVVEVEDGELALEFSDELMLALDLSVGDVFKYTIKEDTIVVDIIRKAK